MQGMGAALLGCWRMLLKWEQLYREHPAASRVPIPTENSPKSCLNLEQEDFCAQQVPDPPLCSPSHCPTAVQVLLFKSLGRNFPGKSGAGSVPAQPQQPGLPPAANTTPICDIIWDKLSAPSPRGNTNSSWRIERHLGVLSWTS